MRLLAASVCLLACACSSASSGPAPAPAPPPTSTGTGNPTGGGPYPQGPYGTQTGNIVPPTLTWQGFLPGSSDVTTLGSASYYDPDGSKGINAIVFDQSSSWCTDCQTEASGIDALMQSKWTAEGVTFVTLMVEDTTPGVPATVQTAETWKTQFHLQDIAVAVDPKFTFKKPSGNGIPMSVIVDPRTMTILDKLYNTPDPPEVDQLAQKNKP